MKKINFILFLCFSITLLSCGDDDDTPVLTLSTSSVAGEYTIKSLDTNLLEEATSSGTTVTVSTTVGKGDTFETSLITLNSNGTYTTSGGYRLVSTKTPNNGGSPEETKTLIFLNGSGTFTVNTVDNTIKFNTTNDALLSGTYTIVSFNDTILNLTKESETVVGSITNTNKTTINFVKK